MMAPELVIRADWDEEAKVWVATSEDVPGLVTEAETEDALMAKLKVMIPELLAANGTGKTDPGPIPFKLHTERHAVAG